MAEAANRAARKWTCIHAVPSRFMPVFSPAWALASCGRLVVIQCDRPVRTTCELHYIVRALTSRRKDISQRRQASRGDRPPARRYVGQGLPVLDVGHRRMEAPL